MSRTVENPSEARYSMARENGSNFVWDDDPRLAAQDLPVLRSTEVEKEAPRQASRKLQRSVRQGNVNPAQSFSAVSTSRELMSTTSNISGVAVAADSPVGASVYSQALAPDNSTVIRPPASPFSEKPAGQFFAKLDTEHDTDPTNLSSRPTRRSSHRNSVGQDDGRRTTSLTRAWVSGVISAFAILITVAILRYLSPPATSFQGAQATNPRPPSPNLYVPFALLGHQLHYFNASLAEYPEGCQKQALYKILGDTLDEVNRLEVSVEKGVSAYITTALKRFKSCNQTALKCLQQYNVYFAATQSLPSQTALIARYAANGKVQGSTHKPVETVEPVVDIYLQWYKCIGHVTTSLLDTSFAHGLHDSSMSLEKLIKSSVQYRDFRKPKDAWAAHGLSWPRWAWEDYEKELFELKEIRSCADKWDHILTLLSRGHSQIVKVSSECMRYKHRLPYVYDLGEDWTKVITTPTKDMLINNLLQLDNLILDAVEVFFQDAPERYTELVTWYGRLRVSN